jgi:hypothetical protein
MNKQFFFLSPVEVVKVTSQNLEEVAEWCGGSVQKTESRRVPGRMDAYVLVPTPKDTNISWAFPGMFITKRLVITVKDELRSTYAVFRRDYFEKNYFDTPKAATDKTWEREAAEKSKPAKPEEVKVTSNVGEALLEAQQKVAELEKSLEDERMKRVQSDHGLENTPEIIESQVVAPDMVEAQRRGRADALMVRKSDSELGQLVMDGHITQNDVRRHKGLPEVLADGYSKVEEPVMTPRIIHNHTHDTPCPEGDDGCLAERYINGYHLFVDKTLLAVEGKETVEVEMPEEEVLDPDTHDLDPRQMQGAGTK